MKIKLINDLKSEVIEVKSIAEVIDVSKKSESEQNEVFNQINPHLIAINNELTKLTDGHVDVPSDVVRCKIALTAVASRLRAMVRPFGQILVYDVSPLPRRKKLIIEASDNMIKEIEKWEEDLQNN